MNVQDALDYLLKGLREEVETQKSAAIDLPEDRVLPGRPDSFDHGVEDAFDDVLILLRKVEYAISAVQDRLDDRSLNRRA